MRQCIIHDLVRSGRNSTVILAILVELRYRADNEGDIGDNLQGEELICEHSKSMTLKVSSYDDLLRKHKIGTAR